MGLLDSVRTEYHWRVFIKLRKALESARFSIRQTTYKALIIHRVSLTPRFNGKQNA